MVVLDAIQLSIIYDPTQRHQGSFASRIRNATLQYIACSETVQAYVSKEVVNQEFWIFLVHRDTQSHEHFLESTIGVGMMLPFLQDPPRVYTFSQSSFNFIVNNANLHLSLYEFDPRPSAANMVRFEKALKDLWSPHAVVFAPGGDENAASFLGMTTETKSMLSAARNHSIDAPQYTVQSQVVNVDRFDPNTEPHAPRLPLPTTTAELLCADPRRYKDISFDVSELGATAQAQDISFRPMEYIAHADWFNRDQNNNPSTDSYKKCMSMTTVHYAQEHRHGEPHHLQATWREFATHPGLLNLYWCKDSHNSRTVRIIAIWKQEKYYRKLEPLLMDRLSAHNSHSHTERDSEFAVFPIQEAPNWDDNTLVELLTFDFSKTLSTTAKTAFEWYLNKFLANMKPSAPNEPSVAQPFGPLWPSERSHQKCAVLISWNGLPAREVWCRNFLAHPYDLSGYIVHGVSLAGAVVKSTTETVHVVDHFRLKYEKEDEQMEG